MRWLLFILGLLAVMIGAMVVADVWAIDWAAYIALVALLLLALCFFGLPGISGS